MIKEFQGEFRWLSNFAPCIIVLNDIEYPSVEHAYMSAKSDDPAWKHYCSKLNVTAGEVKRASRGVKLVDGWNNKKLDIMTECIKQKFNQEPYKSKLIDTGDQHIQEGNMWDDKYWGVCLKTNKGENHLGELIMMVRDEISHQL